MSTHSAPLPRVLPPLPLPRFSAGPTCTSCTAMPSPTTARATAPMASPVRVWQRVWQAAVARCRWRCHTHAVNLPLPPSSACLCVLPSPHTGGTLPLHPHIAIAAAAAAATAADFIELADQLLKDAEGLLSQHMQEISAAEASGGWLPVAAAGGALVVAVWLAGLPLPTQWCGS